MIGFGLAAFYEDYVVYKLRKRKESKMEKHANELGLK